MRYFRRGPDYKSRERCRVTDSMFLKTTFRNRQQFRHCANIVWGPEDPGHDEAFILGFCVQKVVIDSRHACMICFLCFAQGTPLGGSGITREASVSPGAFLGRFFILSYGDLPPKTLGLMGIYGQTLNLPFGFFPGNSTF